MAHIVARSRGGPRGGDDLDPAERNKAENLVLLCCNCHKKVDDDKLTFTAKVLRQMKSDHETRVRERVSGQPPVEQSKAEHHEMLSTLLPVEYIPSFVYSAPCEHTAGEVNAVLQSQASPAPALLTPYILRDGSIMSFTDLAATKGIFAPVVDPTLVTRIPVSAMLESEDHSRRYVALMNWALDGYCRALGLGHDQRHDRYYFVPKELGQAREEEYASTAGLRATRKVVWQPTTRLTGMPKRFWLHVAASLRFHRLGRDQWGLSIRPERHLTHDGVEPLPPDEIGRRVTRLKARMYNGPYLDEVNLWRSYLSGSRPRVLLRFDGQAVVIGTKLLTFKCSHPAIPGAERAVSDRQYEEDLFSLADFTEAVSREEREADETEDEFRKYDVD